MPQYNQHINLLRIKAVATALQELNENVVFVGGATVALYADVQKSVEIRPTNDVDVVIELASYKNYGDLDERLRSIGFQNDVESGVICRYKVQGIIVDVMPTTTNILGFSNRWYVDGFRNAIEHELFEGFFVKIFNSAYFIATKLEAHKMRGGSDFRTSTDFEDIVFVLDNCPTISNDLSSISDDLGQYLKVEFTNLIKHPDIKEGIYAHIEPRFAAHRSMKILEFLESFVNRNI
jgi:predicted nucleotidyltransferase